MTAIEHGLYRIGPVGADDLLRYNELAGEIYQLLSDEKTLQFLPEKKLYSVEAAKSWLNTALLNFHSGRNQVHLIRPKAGGALLGIIDLIPPAVAREHYQLTHYPHFIEFYLKSTARGNALMSRLLPKVLAHLQAEGVNQLAAVVNRQNMAARKVLKRSGFRLQGNFDLLQDLYLY
jgi:RimJ/RimL family protein N-acetyltransferase